MFLGWCFFFFVFLFLLFVLLCFFLFVFLFCFVSLLFRAHTRGANEGLEPRVMHAQQAGAVVFGFGAGVHLHVHAPAVGKHL